MYARLGFSVAIDIDPDILLVDEILAVGDDRFQEKCQKEFKKLLSAGKTVVIVTHDLGMISDLADQILLLSRGKVEFLGNPEEAIRLYHDEKYKTAL